MSNADPGLKINDDFLNTVPESSETLETRLSREVIVKSDGWSNPINRDLSKRKYVPLGLGVILAIAVFLVYSNSLQSPFQYDDFNDVLANQSIRHLWPLWDIINFHGEGYSTRPVANLIFAINYRMGGLKPFHYHVTNLIIHILAALTFMGVVRRTLSLPALKKTYADHALALSLITAALWALHPLLTESVSYITQRYESLMGLFVLLCFYCVLRLAVTTRPTLWALLASLSCLFALGSKEVAVAVPFLVLMFDRIFLSGSFRRAWRERRLLYLGLLLTWVCFLYIQVNTAKRGFAGFGLEIPWWRYGLNQPSVILHYLRLAIWPHPLNFDYFWQPAKSWSQLLPGLVMIGSLLGLTVWGLFRKPTWAFLAVFFFLILAPTSSIMPILDLAVEHRMYLPLTAVIVFIVLMVHFLIFHTQDKAIRPQVRKLIVIVFVTSALPALGTLTYLRNEEYRSTTDLWQDVVNNNPNNPRAHHNYAYHLAQDGYLAQALLQYAIAVKQAPGTPLYQSNFGVSLMRAGRYSESLDHIRIAIKLDPTNYKHYINLGSTLFTKGSLDNAIICYKEAIKINPQAAPAYASIAAILCKRNQLLEAKRLMETAIRLEPDNASFHYRLGMIFLMLKDQGSAAAAFQTAVRLDENPAKMASEVGWVYHAYGMDTEAVLHLRSALSLNPKQDTSQIRLAWILATSQDDSVRRGAEALRLADHLLQTQVIRPYMLLDLKAVALAELGRFSEAEEGLKEALSQSKDKKDAWVPELEKRLVLFESRKPFREKLNGAQPQLPAELKQVS